MKKNKFSLLYRMIYPSTPLRSRSQASHKATPGTAGRTDSSLNSFFYYSELVDSCPEQCRRRPGRTAREYFHIFSLMITYSFTLFTASLINSAESITLDTLYGTYEITEPVLIDLLNAPSVQRLKKVNQYGVNYYLNAQPYTRYEHSVGVLVLLRRFGASEQEQVAGLLHDVSHTVFSHVGDHVLAQQNNAKFSGEQNMAYQDVIHNWFLQQTELADILAHHNLSVEDVWHKNEIFPMMAPEHSEMNADRLEYILHGAYLESMWREEDINALLEKLRFESGHWFFIDQEKAKMFGVASLALTEHVFAAPWNLVVYTSAARALLRAVAINLISLHDINFSTDDVVWRLLNESDDLEIQHCMNTIREYNKHFVMSTEDDYDLVLKSKCRGVNPLVLYNQQLSQLTELDTDFAQEFHRVKQLVTNPRYVKLIDD
ncbi:MAG: HD domain-containing protein [bacterium]|nr:HD domain-containing protein [bacterium]